MNPTDVLLPFEILIPFALASTLLALSPGPDNIFVLTQSAVSGVKTGLCITLGLCSGLIFHTGLVAFGIAAIFRDQPLAFLALKIIGALYLVYLAWKALGASVSSIDADTEEQRRYLDYFIRGVVMNITNPKVSIFFLAFLPQFAVAENGSMVQQIFVLGAVFMLCAFVVFACIAIFSGALGSGLTRHPKSQLWLNRIAAIVFVGLAIRLLFVR